MSALTAAVSMDVGTALTGLGALLAAYGGLRARKGSKDAQRAAETVADAVGAPNGNGPANAALHVVIEMLKYQDQKLTHISETVSASGSQLDELTLIVRDHMTDPLAHMN